MSRAIRYIVILIILIATGPWWDAGLGSKVSVEPKIVQDEE